MDLFSVFLKGGVIMWAILVASIIGVTLVIDRYLVLKKAKTNTVTFLIKIKSLLKKKDVDGAISFCMEERTPAANIIKKGLKKFRFGHSRVREAIEDAGRQEITKLERGLSTLATISGVAPMLGFLGTVTGMVTAFATIQDLQGAANPADLAGGIWEALITTVFGLIVGIIMLTAYNYFISAIKKLVSEMESLSIEVVDTVEEINSGKPVTDNFDED
ncbi:MAG: MotA/TolQ/ExbB proton channel family protein [Chlorobiaceae bacterium]|nr:MotA/TolQ/ExbB proton channel family protein [Chlorobiaceae bacterium]MBA4308964.1 MotA/TolQ/ExbB proton channel family protein [Chlorobiaceae bacterium]